MSSDRSAEGSGTSSRRHHEYVKIDDPGIVAMASGGPFTATDVNMIAATSSYLRSTRCAAPGCGKPREDPVHAPPDA
jgi:hypothetical protein